ncbi:MAG: hypothetical protein J1D86_01960 [Alistipes sp.]|nr:hypothetical protein [Alistipes sp.]
MRRIVAIISAMLFASGCYDSFDNPPVRDTDPENANITIAELNSLYRDGTVVITQELTIAGTVTSSDKAGNFRYSFTIEQDGAAVEILARQSDLHNIYPKGCRTAVRLRGLALGQTDGVKQIGMPPADYGYYPVDYIPSRQQLDLHISRSEGPGEPGPHACRPEELREDMCGRLVRITGLLHSPEEEAESIAGYTVFNHDDGMRIAVYVRPYADFAEMPVPEGSTAVTGILLHGRVAGEDMFIIKPRDERDFMSYD